MATISATWRRTISVRPYETETLELSVEQDTSSSHPVDRTAELSRELSSVGDTLIAERLRALGKVEEKKAPTAAAPTEPDPFV